MSEIFKILDWFDGHVIAQCEAETLKEALEKLVSQYANLQDANLQGANLQDANLQDANLQGANLQDAKLQDANLQDANLQDAKLQGANLQGANLQGANLQDANLQFIKHDLWGVLLHAQHEVDGLKLALEEGRVDGSCYEGECACLVGTIANVRGCNYRNVDGISPDSTRPSEVWFMGIAKGDTAKKNQIVKITLGWIKEFQKLVGVKP